MGLLQPEAGVLFWMTLAFAVVFIVLARYGFPVIVRAIEERKAYIDRSLEEARAAGARSLVLETQSCNDPAIRFYRKHGFALIGFDLTAYSETDVEKQEVRLEFARPV